MKTINKLVKEIVTNGLPKIICDLPLRSKGMPICKEKDGIIEYDIRPIVITDAIIRILDNLIINNVDQKDGPYQMIGERNACKIATISLDFALDLVREFNELSAINVDAANAYNSINRNPLGDLIDE